MARDLRKTMQVGRQEAVMTCRGLLSATAALASASRLSAAAIWSAAKKQLVLKWPAAICISTAVTLTGIIGHTAQAEDAGISSRRSSERTSFSNDEIMDGFFKIAFGAELQLGKRVERIRKFDEPVRVFVFNEGASKRRAQLAAIIADIRARVNHLDLAMTDDIRAANFVVMLVQKRNLKRTIRSLYGRDRTKQIQQSLNPQCLSGFGKDERYRINHAEVILPVDAGDFVFYDCAYEELLQALGPINDDRSVPWTMFNDDVQMGFFDVYDQYLLNILYDPRIRPGMTKAEVGALLPDVLPTVREWVANTNSLQDAQSGGASNADAQCGNCLAPVRESPIISE
jgi:hypothetical protein